MKFNIVYSYFIFIVFFIIFFIAFFVIFVIFFIAIFVIFFVVFFVAFFIPFFIPFFVIFLTAFFKIININNTTYLIIKILFSFNINSFIAIFSLFQSIKEKLIRFDVFPINIIFFNRFII